MTVRRYEKQINRRQPRFSSFSPISDVTCQACQGSSISRSVPSHLRSVHTRRQVAATCRNDKSLRVIFVKIFLCNIILSQQHVARNQIRQNLCDFLCEFMRHFSRIHQAICRRNMLLQLVARPVHGSDLSSRRVAATCRLVCTDLKSVSYTHLTLPTIYSV